MAQEWLNRIFDSQLTYEIDHEVKRKAEGNAREVAGRGGSEGKQHSLGSYRLIAARICLILSSEDVMQYPYQDHATLVGCIWNIIRLLRSMRI
jgi:hypothetical protein